MVADGRITFYDMVTPPPWHRPPLPDPAGRGVFFADQVPLLPAGPMAARVQVMLPPFPPENAEVTVTLEDRATEPSRVIAQCRWRLSPRVEEADHLMLRFDLPAPVRPWLVCHASTQAGSFRVRAATIRRTGPGIPEDWSTTDGTRDRWPLDHLRSVMIGNSGVCTAACFHCPTNKPWLPVPTPSVMSDLVFERLVQGLVECRLPIRDSIGFGLFGDPLTDRNLAARIRRVKDALPGVRVTISTTGAAYAPRQAEAIALADSIGVHVESIDPATYGRLMAPLRLDAVKPRIEALVRVAGRKAQLAVPVHRDSLPGLGALRAWWDSIGGGDLDPLPFTNRLIVAPEVLGMHLAPVTGACTQDLAYDLIVDWDGQIVTCCNDFGRDAGLGSLAERSLPDLLEDERRRLLFQRLRNREWQSIGICRTCLFDSPPVTADAAARACRGQAVG